MEVCSLLPHLGGIYEMTSRGRLRFKCSCPTLLLLLGRTRFYPCPELKEPP